jgi:hypothetical protein
MNPFGVACTSIKSETQIQKAGEKYKKPESRELAPLLMPRTFQM